MGIPYSRWKDARIQAGYSKREDAANEVGITFETYRDWELGYQKTATENYERIVALADLSNVSTDYLLGASDYRNIGDKELCESTGLSQEAVNAIRNNKDNEPRMRLLNAMLEDESLWDVFDDLEKAKHIDLLKNEPIPDMDTAAAATYYDLLNAQDVTTQYVVLEGEDAKTLYMDRAIRIVRDLFKRLF